MRLSYWLDSLIARLERWWLSLPWWRQGLGGLLLIVVGSALVYGGLCGSFELIGNQKGVAIWAMRLGGAMAGFGLLLVLMALVQKLVELFGW